MASALDVAAYILQKQGPMTAMKLQKLCYYAQAWSLVWDDAPLFREKIEAWANGPVIPRLYAQHAGRFQLDKGSIAGDADALTSTQRDTVNAVLRHYGAKSSQWLSELTHRERPWLKARRGMSPSDRGKTEITRAAMAEYYGSL